MFKVKNDNSQIIITVDCIHTQRTDGYKALLKDLPDTQPRYILYDYEFKTAHYDSVGGSGRATSSILLIYWNPDNGMFIVDCFFFLLLFFAPHNNFYFSIPTTHNFPHYKNFDVFFPTYI